MTGLNRAPFLLPAFVLSITLAGLVSPAPLSAQELRPSAMVTMPQALFLATPETPDSLPSSSAPNFEAPAAETISTKHLTRQVTPFSALALGVKLGIAGIGFDVATPVAQRFNVRGGASFFSYSSSFNADGTTINGDLKLRSVNASLDWYPFNNRFRISPGVTIYNGNGLNATAMVPGGQSFDLGDATYTSSTTDPIHGSAAFYFGNRTAPSLTFGFGNMIPRHGEGHFSVPVELGFQYIGTPKITLALAGTACTNGFCQSTANNPQFQANLQQENNDLNSDISPFRFYPIASIGVAYRF